MFSKNVLALGAMLLAAAAGAGEVVCQSTASALKISNGQVMLEAAPSGPLKFSSLDAQNGAPSMTVSLSGAGSNAAIIISRWVVEKNTPAEATIRFYSAKPEVLVASCSLGKDADYLGLTAGQPVDSARASFPSESAVQPAVDSGEDLVYWPDELKPLSRVRGDGLYLLNLMNGGTAMAAFLWNTRETEVRLDKKAGESARFDGAQFKFGAAKHLWIGWVTAPDLWQTLSEPAPLTDSANTTAKGKIMFSKKAPAFRAKLLAAAAAATAGAAAGAGEVVCESTASALKISNGHIMLEAAPSSPLKFSSLDAQNGAPGMTLSLSGAGSNAAVTIKRWVVEKNTPAEATVRFYTEKPEAFIAACTIRTNSDYLSLTAGRHVEGVRAEFPSEIAVLPDMVSDEDFIYWPDELKRVSRVPGDGFCLLHLMNGGSAMAAFMWNTRETEVLLEKKSEQSAGFDCNQFKFGCTKQLWIGFVTAPGLWHKVSEPLRLKEFTKINWTAPFTSNWRMTMKFDKGPMPLMDNNYITWHVPYKSSYGLSFIAMGFFDLPDPMTLWTSYMEGFLYPCYFQKGEFYACYTSILNAVFSKAKPPLIYTYKNQSKETPKVLPFLILQQCLPDYKFSRLEVSPSDEEMGVATCGITPAVLRYFKDDKVKQNKDAIIDKLDAMDKFVEGKEKRVHDFRKWAAAEISWLKQVSAETPELKPLAEKFAGQLAVIEQIYAEKKDAMKTPADSYRLSQEIINLTDSALPTEKLEEACDKLGREIRTLGGRRDNLTAQLYSVVKAIRFKTTAMLAENLTPAEAALVLKLRADCGERLWLKEKHDGK